MTFDCFNYGYFDPFYNMIMVTMHMDGTLQGWSLSFSAESAGAEQNCKKKSLALSDTEEDSWDDSSSEEIESINKSGNMNVLENAVNVYNCNDCSCERVFRICLSTRYYNKSMWVGGICVSGSGLIAIFSYTKKRKSSGRNAYIYSSKRQIQTPRITLWRINPILLSCENVGHIMLPTKRVSKRRNPFNSGEHFQSKNCSISVRITL